MHLVMRGHFRSRENDGGHISIRHIPKPHATRQLHGWMFYRTGVTANASFTLRE